MAAAGAGGGLFDHGFAAGRHRYQELPPAACAADAPFLQIWRDAAVFDFVGGLRPPVDLGEVRRHLGERREMGGWARQGPGVPHYALYSDYTSLVHVGLYAGVGPTEQRGIWEDGRADAARQDWSAALAGLCEHVFAARPEVPFVVHETRLVVPELLDEALMLLGWEPFGAEASRQPQRACYRLMREVHALYQGG